MTREVGLYRYDAFGVTIRSQFPLPELPAIDPDDGAADVEVVEGSVASVDEASADDVDGARRMAIEPERVRFTYESVGSVRVEDGERVVVDPEREDVPSTKVFRRLLEGQVLAVVLHQRGLLVLHASAVAVDGRAAIFLGPSGVGKTTTAAAFYAAGHSLLEDDLVAVEFDDGLPAVRPGVPELKLYPEVAADLGVDVRPPDADDAGSPKQYHRTDVDGDRSAVPLAGCYQLAEGPEPAVEPVPPQERMVSLVSNTYTVGMLETTGTSAENFRQCAAIAERVPMARVERPDDVRRLPELVDLVADHLSDADRSDR